MNISDLYVQLDHNPADMLLRRAIRDMHEELGENELCLGHDYLLHHRKHPIRASSGRITLYTKYSTEVPDFAKIPHPLIIHLSHIFFTYGDTLQTNNTYSMNASLSRSITEYKHLLNTSSYFISRRDVKFRGSLILTHALQNHQHTFHKYKESDGAMLQIEYYATLSIESAYDYEEKFLYF